MRTPFDITTMLIREGVAEGSLTGCLLFVQGYERQHENHRLTNQELCNAVITPLVDIQAVCSPAAFATALGRAVAEKCFKAAYVGQLASTYDDSQWDR